MSLDPPEPELRRLAHLVADRIVDSLVSLGSQRVAKRYTATELAADLAEPLPRMGLGVESSVTKLFADVVPKATLVHHPRFFAYIPGPGSFVGALGEWLAAGLNPFVGTWLGGAAFAQLEVETLRWLAELVGVPGYAGIVTSGGSLANLSALAAARQRIGNLARATIYVSEEAHYSLAKAARVLGFAPGHVRAVRTDAALRMDVAELARTITADRTAGLEPCAVAATLGTTSTGAVDPLQAIGELCAREEIWFHVDAAYGGAVALLPEMHGLCAGVERADSITIDAHKWLYAPFECGTLLVRDETALRAAFAADGLYMQDIPRNEVNFFERGPELTRGARALKLWMLLRSVGSDAIADAVRTDLHHARLARELLAKDERISILTEPSLSVFTFAVRGGEAAGRALVERILADGYLMLSSTKVRGEFALRFCAVNHRTTQADVRSSAERILALL